MNLSKGILKKIYKYIVCILLIACSFVVIRVLPGFFYYVFLDKDCDYQYVRGCMSAGLSEEICKSKIYK